MKGGVESLTNPIGLEWFEALSESDEEALFNHDVHVSRFNFSRQQSDAASFLG